MNTTSLNNKTQLPWWTWVAPILLFHIASQVALLFRYEQGVSSFYVPTAIAIVLINWWGVKRILPAMYMVTTMNTYYWGVEEWWLWPIFSASEVVSVGLSYVLFRKAVKGKYWLPSTRQLILFICFALLIPISIELVLLQYTLIFFNQQTHDTFGEFFLRNWLGEFMANFGIALPLLYSVTPLLQRRNWLYHKPDESLHFPTRYSRSEFFELGLTYCSLMALSILIPFEKYWFAYGIISLYVAIRFGFGAVAVCNLFVFLITYVLPFFLSKDPTQLFSGDDPLYSIFLGNLLLSLFAAITGRVISDLHQTEKQLHQRNIELETTNKELDRFVYSASHDLSAPLKSILGLIGIIKIDNHTRTSDLHINQIEKSVLRLESFINEILDYSRNKRVDITAEPFELKEFCCEILDNLKYMDEFSRVQVDLKDLNQIRLVQDKVRLKIILSNLVSNAIRFQKKDPDHTPLIRISSARTTDKILIRIEDNGEGIRPELSTKVFDMFFRASDTSKGSGLGLYIAKESAQKIGARIHLDSEFGKGTTFTVELPEIIAF